MTNRGKREDAKAPALRSLIDRLDDPPNASTQRDLGCHFQSRSGSRALSWPTPIFSRLAIDLPPSVSTTIPLQRLRRSCGISVVESESIDGKARSSGPIERSLDDGASIVPVFVDEPLDLNRLMHAEQIELQFFPSRKGFASANSSDVYSAEAWSPTLPADLLEVDRLSKRIELLRNTTDQTNAIVGACIAAGKVYDDVRYLVDSGVDYVCVLSQAIAGMRSGKAWTFQNCEESISLARKGLDDAGVDAIRLLISAPIDSVEDGVRYLNAGADGIAIDAWIVRQQPETSQAPTKDDVSSFLGGLGRPAPVQPMNEWIVDAFSRWIQDWNGLRRLYEV